MSRSIKRVSIVGYGRFGKTLFRLLRDDFELIIIGKNNPQDIAMAETVFYCVPISSFESVIKSHKKFFKQDQLLIDVLSVKQHPKKVFEKHLKGLKTQALLIHPMFGPDSSKNGFSGLPITIDRFRADDGNFDFWKNFFVSKELKVIELTAKQHDKLAANSQGLTHFLGRLLDVYGLKPTSIDSLGTKKLLEIKDQTCNDSWQLFTDLQHYNPYTVRMRIKLGVKFDRLFNELLPKQLHPKGLVFGIQGGKGSFNEEAINYYLKLSGEKNYKIKYLYTSANVLRALHEGIIDRGQFAIHNSAGGIVDESIQAMAQYKFKIINKFAIKIAHALMIRNDADFSEITTIITHPQVLAQCKQTLLRKYPNLKQISGKGKYVDHALLAKHLGKKEFPKHVATMGSRVLAQLYGLKIVEDNLQDLTENYTTFMVVSRI